MAYFGFGLLITAVVIAWAYWSALSGLSSRPRNNPNATPRDTDAPLSRDLDPAQSEPLEAGLDNHEEHVRLHQAAASHDLVITDDASVENERDAEDTVIDSPGSKPVEATGLTGRHTLEQIIIALSRAEWVIRGGGTIRQACFDIGVSETTLLRWRRQYGGLSVDQVQRLETVETDNASLNQQLNEFKTEVERLELENATLRRRLRRVGRVA